MSRKDFSDLENQIKSVVNNAFKAVDFANLKKDINDKTDYTINQFKSKINDKADYTMNQFKSKVNGYNERYMKESKTSKKDISTYINKKPAGRVSSMVYIVFGILGSFIYGVGLLIFSILKLAVGNGFAVGSYIILGILLAFFAVSLGALGKGINSRNRVIRFKKYVKFINGNNYLLIKDLSNFSKQKEKFVIKDLNKMINLGMFLEGHIDKEKTYFMLNNEVYEDYLNLKKQQEYKENINEKVDEETEDSKEDKIASTIKIGREYIEQIGIIRCELYKEDIGIKLDKLRDIANQILSYVEKNPKKIREVNKFINHYLPMTIKLVSSYEELNNQVVQSENIKNAKNEIEKSIDLINTAFENLLDDLFEDIALDISTDISVLKTLFKQEGLAGEDFKK